MPEDLETLLHCRMVLCLASDSVEHVRALGERGVPAVGLDATAGDAIRLHAHRHKFDGAVVDLDAFDPAEHARVLRAVDEALAPGGRLVTRRAGELRNQRKDPVSPPASPGLVVGPYADLFAGCQDVVELGCGNGAFLDAVRIRDARCLGFEQDPGLAARARANGHEVQDGGLPELLGRRDRAVDGVFVGNVIEAVPAGRLPALLLACRAALAPDGRAVLRAARGFVERVLRPAIDPAAWAGVHVSRVPRDETDAAVLLRAGPEPGPAPVEVPALELPTAHLPINQPPASWFDLERCERRVTSQCGEDGVLAAIFARCGVTDRYYVEFGCGDGVQCNTRQLRLQGWTGLLMDGAARPGADDVVIHAHWITAENVNELFDGHGVPAEPDLMSIDLDGNDYWVWSAIRRRPRVVVAEYNGNLAADRALTVPYDPEHRWDGSDFYGASLLALVKLARQKGYTLVYCTTSGVNAFFVRDDLVGDVARPDPLSIWRPANYWYRGGRSRPDLSRSMVEV